MDTNNDFNNRCGCFLTALVIVVAATFNTIHSMKSSVSSDDAIPVSMVDTTYVPPSDSYCVDDSDDDQQDDDAEGADDAYDDGYADGSEQGRKDGETALAFQMGYDDTNDYQGHDAALYRQGYEEGYEDGYAGGKDYLATMNKIKKEEEKRNRRWHGGAPEMVHWDHDRPVAREWVTGREVPIQVQPTLSGGNMYRISTEWKSFK